MDKPIPSSADLKWLAGVPEEPTFTKAAENNLGEEPNPGHMMCSPVHGKCLWVAPTLGPYTPVHTYQPYRGENLLCSSPPHLTTSNSAPSHPYSTILPSPNSHLNADSISSSMIWSN